jgi:hypothetical protein
VRSCGQIPILASGRPRPRAPAIGNLRLAAIPAELVLAAPVLWVIHRLRPSAFLACTVATTIVVFLVDQVPILLTLLFIFALVLSGGL